MTRPILSILMLITLALFSGPASPLCAAAGAPPGGEAPVAGDPEGSDRGPIVARVNGEPIYKIDHDAAVQSFMKNQGLPEKLGDDQMRQVRDVVLEGLIGSELLHQKAQSIPIEVSSQEIEETVSQTREALGEDGFQAELRRRSMTESDVRRLVKHNLMVQKLIQDLILPRVDITEKEIQEFYDQHQAEMKKPEKVEASHILVKSNPSDSSEQKAEARRRIEEAARRARAGEDFAVLAREYSDDGTASHGGKLGAIQRGQTETSFEEAAFRLGEGEVSEVVESPYGYHVIKVTDRKEQSVASLDEAHDTIARFLKQKKAEDAIEQMVESLRAEARIEMP